MSKGASGSAEKASKPPKRKRGPRTSEIIPSDGGGPNSIHRPRNPQLVGHKNSTQAAREAKAARLAREASKATAAGRGGSSSQPMPGTAHWQPPSGNAAGNSGPSSVTPGPGPRFMFMLTTTSPHSGPASLFVMNPTTVPSPMVFPSPAYPQVASTPGRQSLMAATTARPPPLTLAPQAVQPLLSPQARSGSASPSVTQVTSLSSSPGAPGSPVSHYFNFDLYSKYSPGHSGNSGSQTGIASDPNAQPQVQAGHGRGRGFPT